MSEPELQISDARSTSVGALRVRRALPVRGRRTVGAWCFIDHMGPATLSPDNLLEVAPHPHIGLQTVTWLFEGSMLHRDSLGSEQLIRPGQLNLMTSGLGIAHAEENPGVSSGQLHGVQLWVALPSETKDAAAAFEHHQTLPNFDLANGIGTLLVGRTHGVESPARYDSELVGMELQLRRGRSELALLSTFEHAVVVTEGCIRIDGVAIEPGHLAYLGTQRTDVTLDALSESRVMIVGGVPFEEPIVMWWNFVARSQDEISAAYESWRKDDGRFARVRSKLAPIEVGPPPWYRGER